MLCASNLSPSSSIVDVCPCVVGKLHKKQLEFCSLQFLNTNVLRTILFIPRVPFPFTSMAFLQDQFIVEIHNVTFG